LSTVIASSALFSGGGLPLGSLLKFHAKKAPKAAALIAADEVVTFADLDARSNRRARMLAQGGVKAGDFVTVGLPNGLEFYETTFAIWKLGAVPNIVSYRLAQPEIDAIVDLVRPSAVIGVCAPTASGRTTFAAGTELDLSLAADALPEAVAPHWKAMTSGGSTGRPKVILDAMPGRWSPDQFALGQSLGDVILNPGPLYHNAPFIGVHFGLFAGSTVVEMGRFDAERALELIQRHRVTWVNLVPTMMHRIWRLGRETLDRYDVSSLKVVFHMAAPCPIWLKEAWIDWLGPERIFELYAGTERQGTTVISGAEWLERKGSVGRAQPGSRIAILDENGEPCAAGEVGEIFFLPDAGPSSTYAYLGSEPRRRGDWESLGDLGRLDADGYLYLSDRRTDLILSGGANIYPAEVEAALDAHPDVLSSIVVGLPDDDLGERVHAIVQRALGSDLQAETLLGFAAGLLARNKLPRSVEFTTEPLRDDAGKARRTALKAERSR
jgi:bile acid-coenzyme A ligase